MTHNELQLLALFYLASRLNYKITSNINSIEKKICHRYYGSNKTQIW